MRSGVAWNPLEASPGKVFKQLYAVSLSAKSSLIVAQALLNTLSYGGRTLLKIQGRTGNSTAGRYRRSTCSWRISQPRNCSLGTLRSRRTTAPRAPGVHKVLAFLVLLQTTGETRDFSTGEKGC